MLGTIINAVAIVVGGSLGLLFRRGIPSKYNQTLMYALSLAVILVGLRSALKSNQILLIICSMAIGGLIGEALRIEDRLNRFGKWLEVRFIGSGNGVAKGFVTASLVFCVGPMAVLGALDSGLMGNHQTLFAKSVLDGIASIVFSSTLGAGVVFSALSVLIYQGLIVVCASLVKAILTPMIVDQMSAVGGLLIVAIGLNILDITKLKVGNMLPAVFIPLAYGLIRYLSAS